MEVEVPVAHNGSRGSVSCVIFVSCTEVQGQLDVISASAGQGSKNKCIRWFASSARVVCIFRSPLNIPHSEQFEKTMIQAIRIEFPNLSNAIRQKIRLVDKPDSLRFNVPNIDKPKMDFWRPKLGSRKTKVCGSSKWVSRSKRRIPGKLSAINVSSISNH